MNDFKTKFHRDGTVTVWDCYTQLWSRTPASQLVARCPQLMASVPPSDRRRIERMAAKAGE